MLFGAEGLYVGDAGSWEEVTGRVSDLQPTRRMGMVGPQMSRTSSIHWGMPLAGEGERERGADLCGYVLERVRGVDGKGDENDVGF